MNSNLVTEPFDYVELPSNNCYAIKLSVPSGSMNFIITEHDDGTPFYVKIYIGKSGSNLAAWISGVEELINLALKKGAQLEVIINLLSNHRSDKYAKHRNIELRSDIEGIVYALLMYKEAKWKERNKDSGKPKLIPRYLR